MSTIDKAQFENDMREARRKGRIMAITEIGITAVIAIAIALAGTVLFSATARAAESQGIASLEELQAGLKNGYELLGECRDTGADCSKLESAMGQIGLAAKYQAEVRCNDQMSSGTFYVCVRGHLRDVPGMLLTRLMEKRLRLNTTAEGRVIVEEVVD